MTTQSDKQSETAAGRRVVTQVTHLDTLIGAHPDALRRIYGAGKPADPAELGDTPRGRLLAVQVATPVHMVARRLVTALASDRLPWKGSEFDHGGNSGTNVIVGRNMHRFRTQLMPSEIDGEPTLALLYGEKAHRNPWPVRAIKDELRSIGSGLAIGPMLMEWQGRWHHLLWFGLERTHSG